MTSQAIHHGIFRSLLVSWNFDLDLCCPVVAHALMITLSPPIGLRISEYLEETVL